MTNTVDQQAGETPAVNDKGDALAVHLHYLIGFLTGITALVRVISAYVKKPPASDFLQSHFQFQVRTFWIGLLYLGVGSFLLFLYIGGPILLWWLVWTLVRVIKGLILLNDGRPIPQPTSWLFG